MPSSNVLVSLVSVKYDLDNDTHLEMTHTPLLSVRLLRSSASCARTRWTDARRQLQSTSTPPHAYIAPLDLAKVDNGEELEGTMTLVMDRKDARNALSVRMVNVRHPLSWIARSLLMVCRR